MLGISLLLESSSAPASMAPVRKDTLASEPEMTFAELVAQTETESVPEHADQNLESDMQLTEIVSTDGEDLPEGVHFEVTAIDTELPAPSKIGPEHSSGSPQSVSAAIANTASAKDTPAATMDGVAAAPMGFKGSEALQAKLATTEFFSFSPPGRAADRQIGKPDTAGFSSENAVLSSASGVVASKAPLELDAKQMRLKPDVSGHGQVSPAQVLYVTRVSEDLDTHSARPVTLPSGGQNPGVSETGPFPMPSKALAAEQPDAALPVDRPVVGKQPPTAETARPAVPARTWSTMPEASRTPWTAVLSASEPERLHQPELLVAERLDTPATLRADLSPTLPSIESRPIRIRDIPSQVGEIVRLGPEGSAELQLHPEELGRLKISFHHNEHGNSISVSVSAERGDTLDLMRRHIADLHSELRRLGYDSVAFSFGQGERRGYGSSPQQEPLEKHEQNDLARPAGEGRRNTVHRVVLTDRVDIRL